MFALAASAVLLVSGAGCSREPQNAIDADKKINLALPKPMVHADTPQKRPGKTEVEVEKEVTKVGAAGAAPERALPHPAASKPNSVPASAGITKKARKKTHKGRAAAAISQQRSGKASMRPKTVGEEVTSNKERDARPSKGVEHYQQSDNPLHPSYEKK